MKKMFPLIKDYIRRADMVLFTLSMICAVFGLIAINSAVASLDNPARYIIVQLACVFIGIALFILFTVIDIDIFADKWPILIIFEVFLVLLLLTPLGDDGGTGNLAWLRLGAIGVQPSEVVKVVFIICMAKHISYLRNYKNLNSIISVSQLAVHCLFTVGLIVAVSRDMGSASVYVFIFITMLFAAGLKLRWFLVGLAGMAAITPFFWTHVLNDRYRDRIRAPYNSSIDPLGIGVNWQTTQSKIALANGQFWGIGYSEGPISQSSNPNLLPEKQTDFIFSVIGEEMGMIACLAVFALLMAIIIRCIYVGMRSKDTISMLVCFGVAASFIFQTFENIGMCIGIAPVIGITLPFFSYGGSSMFSMLAAIGLVSGVKYRPKPERFISYR